MPTIIENELKAVIRSAQFKNVYCFYGKDIVSVEKYKNALVSKAVKTDDVYNYHVFDGKNFDYEEFYEACEALPVFAEHVCCVVSDLVANKDGKDMLADVLKYIPDIPETTIVIFFYTSIDITEGKKYPSPKYKKLVDAVSKKGDVCVFELKTAEELAKAIVAKVTKSGGSISKDTAVYLAKLCGCDSMITANETDKLIAYKNGGEITKADIDLVSPRQLEATTYKLASAIARRDKYNSIQLLNDLILEKEEPIKIIYAISGNMLDLYRVKLGIGSRKSTGEIISDFDYKKNMEFRVNNAYRDARFYSTSHLRKCLNILTETDYKIKSSKTDSIVLLQEAIVQMLSLE